jgi:hypothetical protein
LHFLCCFFSFFHLASFAHVSFLLALLHMLKCSTFNLASTPTLLLHIFWLCSNLLHLYSDFATTSIMALLL